MQTHLQLMCRVRFRITVIALKRSERYDRDNGVDLGQMRVQSSQSFRHHVPWIQNTAVMPPCVNYMKIIYWVSVLTCFLRYMKIRNFSSNAEDEQLTKTKTRNKSPRYFIYFIKIGRINSPFLIISMSQL